MYHSGIGLQRKQGAGKKWNRRNTVSAICRRKSAEVSAELLEDEEKCRAVWRKCLTVRISDEQEDILQMFAEYPSELKQNKMRKNNSHGKQKRSFDHYSGI